MVVGDTIFALSSGSPPAAIGVVRISGPDAHRAGESLAGNLPPARQAAVRELRANDGSLLDEALVLRFDASGSATGEDLVELHCHGGRAVVAAVLGALGRLDRLREARPGEFTRRAFENGRIDLTQAEGLGDLLEAETESQRRAALMMAEGGLRTQIEHWRARLLELSALAEAAVDYAEEDGVESDERLSSDCVALAKELGRWLDRPRSEPLRDGVRIVIAGPPNAGKSSLLNALVGYDRAIVTDIPGTTRDHVDVPISLGGVPIRLTDTAGLRDSDEIAEQLGVGRARTLIESADVLVWLGEPADSPSRPHLLRVHPRCDVEGRETAPEGLIAVSSTTGVGLPELTDAIVGKAREILPSTGEIALNHRQAECLTQARDALIAGSEGGELAILAESLRLARSAFDRLTGRAGVEDLLDTLFGRFCLGK